MINRSMSDAVPPFAAISPPYEADRQLFCLSNSREVVHIEPRGDGDLEREIGFES